MKCYKFNIVLNIIDKYNDRFILNLTEKHVLVNNELYLMYIK